MLQAVVMHCIYIVNASSGDVLASLWPLMSAAVVDA